jgi:hypothetical protein
MLPAAMPKRSTVASWYSELKVDGYKGVGEHGITAAP